MVADVAPRRLLIGPNDVLLRIPLTTIRGTGVQMLKGECPVARGLTVGTSR